MQQVIFDGCFVCGPDNKCGLRARFVTTEDGKVEGTFTPDELHSGYENVIHGGIIMSFLDETLGRLAFVKDRLFLTHTLEVTFRRAAVPGVELTAIGELIHWSSKQFRTEGVVMDPDGEVIATAKGRFLVMSESMERRLLPDGAKIVET